MAEREESGYLVHLFVGENNPVETAVLRKICMKYGLCNWSVMHGFLPWRDKPSLRLKIIRMIRKQAISEYCGIRADPFEIQKDNNELLKKVSNNSDEEFMTKGGVLVNKRWDRTKDDWDKTRAKNASKYEISDAEAEKIEIPMIVSLDYLRQQCFRRRQSLLLYRAALLYELAKRKGEKNPDLKIDEMQLKESSEVKVGRAYTRIEKVDDQGIFVN